MRERSKGKGDQTQAPPETGLTPQRGANKSKAPLLAEVGGGGPRSKVGEKKRGPSNMLRKKPSVTRGKRGGVPPPNATLKSSKWDRGKGKWKDWKGKGERTTLVGEGGGERVFLPTKIRGTGQRKPFPLKNHGFHVPHEKKGDFGQGEVKVGGEKVPQKRGTT